MKAVFWPPFFLACPAVPRYSEHYMCPHRYRSGFSLLEAGIVLAVIGLVVGGIVAGTNLVRSREVGSIVEDLQRYDNATQQFADKYNAVAGDMLSATNYWPSSANGNGDKRIADNEMFRHWQHLSNAGLVEGSYTGTSGSGGASHHVPGTNSPRGKIDHTGYGVSYRGTVLGVLNGNVITYGKETSSSLPTGQTLTAQEAESIDKKLDDGLPGKGRVQQWGATAVSGCANSDNANTATYAVSGTDKTCPLLFRLAGAKLDEPVGAAVNGVCDNSVALGCSAGTPASDNGLVACGTTREWICEGVSGGADSPTCSKANAACVVNGVCDNSVALGCTSGVAGSDNGLVACGTTREWVCTGSGGGSDSGTCSKANAACACDANGTMLGTAEGYIVFYNPPGGPHLYSAASYCDFSNCCSGTGTETYGPGDYSLCSPGPMAMNTNCYDSVTCTCGAGGGSTDCPSEGLIDGEANIYGGPGCYKVSCCGGSLITNDPPSPCPWASSFAVGGDCSAAASCNDCYGTHAHGDVWCGSDGFSALGTEFRCANGTIVDNGHISGLGCNAAAAPNCP